MSGDIALVAPVEPHEMDKKTRADMNDLVRRIIGRSVIEGRGADLVLRVYLAGLYHGVLMHKATGGQS